MSAAGGGSAVRAIAALIDRELRTLIREIESYSDDASVWSAPDATVNSAGTIALHIAGNIQHFLGAKLGGTGYVRDRDAEFSRRAVGRVDLVSEIERARRTVAAVAWDNEPWTDAPYPEAVGGCRVGTSEFVLHLLSHLAYHLGQVDYHRRLTTSARQPAGAVAVAELPSAKMV